MTEQLTKKQLGQIRRQYMTVIHGTVKACGHKAKFDATTPPKGNCVDCWVAWFSSCVDLEAVHKVLTEQGVHALTARYGTKFVRMFHGYLAMALKPQPEVITQELV